MKKLIVYYLPYKDFNIDTFLDELIRTKKNSTIIISQNTTKIKGGCSIGCNFISKINNNKHEPCMLEIKRIDLLELFNESIDDLISDSFKTLSRWGDEKICQESFDDSDESKVKIKNQIYRIFDKYYSNLDKSNDFYRKNLLCLISELMFYILMGHHLSNGNKRLSLLLTINLLYFFGYYLKFTRGIYTDYQKYEKKLEGFVGRFSNKNNSITKDIDKISEIYNWLNENVIIAINFRKQ
ncbi:MAG: hypothetical protein RSE95_02495 [Malacoplasma sp.]